MADVERPSVEFCAFCEQAPPPPLREGRLYLHFPLAHTFHKTRAGLAKGGLSPTVQEPLLFLDVSEETLQRAASVLERSLSSVEQMGARALLVAAGTTPELSDFFRVETLDRFIERLHAEPLLDLVRNERLTSVFQPIVRAADPSDIFAYEALLRGPGGATLPHTFFEVARNAALLPALDLAARRSAITGAAAHGITTRLFVNFAPSSIYDPDFCLRTTIATVDSLQIPHERIVFEVVESDEVTDVNHLRNVLQRYRDAGFGVALDDLGSGYASLTLLADLRPDFVKLDMSLIRGVDADRYKALIAGKLIETAHAVDLPVIGEGIETEAEFAWARDNGVDLIQGFYIARPAAPPPTVGPLGNFLSS
jgi:EAL domain-containing protein (putative c-di-GMP-specific phosphodiesterase class I)